jgi:pimeloyl-ACP methyl ester carboxylesterase
VRRAGSPPVFIVGHDMGTSVATELMARDLRGELGFALRGALLFNGSMLLHLAKPTPGQKLLRSRLGAGASPIERGRAFDRNHARGEGAPAPGELGRGPRYYRLQTRLTEPIAMDDAGNETLHDRLPTAAHRLIEQHSAELDAIVDKLAAAGPIAQ